MKFCCNCYERCLKTCLDMLYKPNVMWMNGKANIKSQQFNDPCGINSSPSIN